jgi:hypothetical protein
VVPVPGLGGALRSGRRARVSAGNDVSAADVAFAVVRGSHEVSLCRARIPRASPAGGAALGARVQLTAGCCLDDLAPDSVRAAPGSA